MGTTHLAPEAAEHKVEDIGHPVPRGPCVELEWPFGRPVRELPAGHRVRVPREGSAAHVALLVINRHIVAQATKLQGCSQARESRANYRHLALGHEYLALPFVAHVNWVGIG